MNLCCHEHRRVVAAVNSAAGVRKTSRVQIYDTFKTNEKDTHSVQEPRHKSFLAPLGGSRGRWKIKEAEWDRWPKNEKKGFAKKKRKGKKKTHLVIRSSQQVEGVAFSCSVTFFLVVGGGLGSV